jgi:hypothetical protein
MNEILKNEFIAVSKTNIVTYSFFQSFEDRKLKMKNIPSVSSLLFLFRQECSTWMAYALQIKSVPNSSGQANFIATPASTSNGSTFVAKTEEYVRENDIANVIVAEQPSAPRPKRKSVVVPSDVPGRCDTCKDVGTSANMVRWERLVKFCASLERKLRSWKTVTIDDDFISAATNARKISISTVWIRQ